MPLPIRCDIKFLKIPSHYIVFLTRHHFWNLLPLKCAFSIVLHPTAVEAADVTSVVLNGPLVSISV